LFEANISGTNSQLNSPHDVGLLGRLNSQNKPACKLNEYSFSTL